MRLCTYQTRLRGLGRGSVREGKPGPLTRPLRPKRVVDEMDGEPYTRGELEAAGSGWPARGTLCPHCNQRIPQFAELSGEDERRVRELIREFRRMMATAELRAAT